MELQGSREAKAYELESFGFRKTLSKDRPSVDGIKHDGEQPDVLARLGKLPVLKVSSLFRLKKVTAWS